MVSGDSIVYGIPLSEEPGLGTLTIPGYAREVTTRHAEREALVWRTPSGVERWSYAALWERSVEVAKALIASGVGRGTRVGVLMSNRPECLAAAFGTALAGGVIVMLNTFSTPPELEHLLSASSVSVLLFESSVAKKDFGAMLCDLEPALRTAEPGRLLSTRFPFLRRLAAIGAAEGAIESWPDFLQRGGATPAALVDAAAAATRPADVGALFFSSGTTSRPKGIFHSHRGVAIQWWRWPRIMGLGADVRSWTANGLFWSGNFSMVLGCTLTRGGALVLQATFEPEPALDWIQAERVTWPHAWPHQWKKLTEASNWSAVDLGSVRYVDPGNPLARHPSIRAAWHEPLAFGTTETLTIVTASPDATPGSYGDPLPGNALEIVDPLTGAVVPRGVRGEIAVKGPTLMLGYAGIPADETFDAQGFFHTGDGGFVDEAGRLFWEGRLSDVIKTGGANVSPREIDEVLAGYPGVKICQTVGVPHETLGEMVVSCIVAQEGAALDETALRDFARQRLAAYKVPRRVLFLRDDEIERTGTDKVKASALRQLAVERLGAIRTG
ncbi:MAG TPA: class I adenylate-forming enzyme family protein [Myxococcota bacterium]|nr:class I adenylate-forming enzyme family protein [Myxococcota bacterium]